MTILNSFFGKKGSAKSGNWGHAGRPGRRGGSAPKKKGPGRGLPSVVDAPAMSAEDAAQIREDFGKKPPSGALTDDEVKRVKALATDDYQKRMGVPDSSYPRSGMPTDIYVWEGKGDFAGQMSATAAYKNTSEKEALRSFRGILNRSRITNRTITAGKMSARQSGDYHDDWVEVEISFTKMNP